MRAAWALAVLTLVLAVVRLAMRLPREHPALHRIVEECGL